MKQFSLLMLLLLPGYSYACSCADLSLKGTVEGADIIYIGELKSAELVYPESYDGWHQVQGHLQVKDRIKGYAPDIDLIQTGTGGGDCGVMMTIGREYLIFKRENDIRIGICDGSKQIDSHSDKARIERIKHYIQNGSITGNE
ncbi:hypothetical protein L2750_14735 [Shewanella submarina]|uniref:Uncharacterized protein n=1 Tax=Shewanella submarina TaxID=2016376 RepID=A0ABV7G593_9GAMM|nr:hypothetical protein [Shewanella submarina]MCL1038387.1 hypothetical protein [Shewanella submarina]